MGHTTTNGDEEIKKPLIQEIQEQIDAVLEDPSDAKLQTFIGVMVNRVPELILKCKNQEKLLKEISNAALTLIQE